jgi:aromatic ring-cleaving dioxygenase
MNLRHLMATSKHKAVDVPKHAAVKKFHVHTYFPLTPNGIESGKKFRDLFSATFDDGQHVHTYGVVPRQVGPHPQGHGMWQANVTRNVYTDVLTWLQYNRPAEIPSIMLHPDTEEHVLDHMERSVWLGQRLPLDPTMLYEAQGLTPPPKQAITFGT